MAIFTRIDTSVAPSVSQLNVYDGIKVAFANAGYSAPIDDYISGTDRILVYQITIDATKVYGSAFLKIRVSSTRVIGQQILTNWNVSTHAGLNANTESVYTALTSTNQVNFTALNGGVECKIVIVQQGAVAIFLGYISPENRPSWWNLDSFVYIFHPSSSALSTWKGVNFTPVGDVDLACSLGVAFMADANSQTNRRDILPGIIFYSRGNQGIVGKSSDDLAMVAASGTTRFDTLQIPNDTKEYLLIAPFSGGLAVRTK